MTIALITGITGQDGHHLTKYLLELGYEVHGLVNGQKNETEDKFLTKFSKVKLHRGDLADWPSLLDVISTVKPEEIYNLGAISFVGVSFQQPELTTNITGLGALRLLEVIKKLNLESRTKFYQASSSEMFGKVRETPQNELTAFHPRSPYGVAKTFAHYSTLNYREAYDMHACSGILFNHEGEYRGYEFVTRKITSSIARIKLGKMKKFSLGSLTPRRDWGYAGDYVRAMHAMLQSNSAKDYVIASGVARSVREFVEAALAAADLPVDVEKYVEFDQNQIRPAEVDLLIGDSSLAKGDLGWQPKVDFNTMVSIMVENDLRIESNRN